MDVKNIALDKLCKLAEGGKTGSEALFNYIQVRAQLEREYAVKLQELSLKLGSLTPPHFKSLSEMIQTECNATSNKHESTSKFLLKEICDPMRKVLDEMNMKQNQNVSFIDEIVRMSPNFVVPEACRPDCINLGDKTLKMEKTRFEKLDFAMSLYCPAVGIESGLAKSLAGTVETYLTEMEVVKDSRWKSHVEISYQPLGDNIRFEQHEAGWDVEAHQSYPTLADNPSMALVTNSMPDVSSLNILVDHMVMADFGKPQFHQPTRDPIRKALLEAIKKEADQQGLKFEELDFFYVIGSNQSAHVCLPTSVVDRLLQRICNVLNVKKSSAAEQAQLQNYADIRVRRFKSQSEFTKTMTKADRTTDNFRIGADMLKKMSNIAQFDHLISFDFEAWELGNHLLTELGITVYEPAKSRLSTYHYVIEDNSHLKNGNIMPNHRDHFLFGDSQAKSLSEAYKILCDLIRSGNNVALVGHGIQSDLNMILDAGLPRLPSDACYTLDTQILYLQVDRASDKSRLEDVLEYFSIPARYLHNAGNDAHYTMLICLKLAGVDIQPYIK